MDLPRRPVTVIAQPTTSTNRIADFLAVQLRKQAAVTNILSSASSNDPTARTAAPSTGKTATTYSMIKGRKERSTNGTGFGPPLIISHSTRDHSLAAPATPMPASSPAYHSSKQHRHTLPPPREPSSTAATGNSSSASSPNKPTFRSSSQHDQRIYAESKYDAEFDRTLVPTAAASSSASHHVMQSSGQATAVGRSLFVPSSAAPSSSNINNNAANGATSGTTVADAYRRTVDRDQRERERGREKESQREREQPEQHEGAAAASSSARRSRSKRDPIELSDLGQQKKGRDSKESIASEDSGRPGSRSSKEGGRHRRRTREEGGGGGGGRLRRENSGAEGGSGAGGFNGSTTLVASNSIGGGTSSSSARQLFDPRKDDPVRFTTGPPASSSSSSMNVLMGPGKKNFAPSIMSVASLSSLVSSSEFTLSGSIRHDSISTFISHDDQQRQQQEFVGELKRAYREITQLETGIQEEHRAALAATAREEEEIGHGDAARGQSRRRKVDDEYWVRLAGSHKQLADAHYSFLQMALDSRLPPSMNLLPQKYSIPARLWQTAFHQLLERLRHAITTSSPSSPTTSSSASANVLEHLIEFIQYAYGFYSQLFEDPTVAVFRSSWIEQLGDLARYRMAVAGLASRVSAAQARLTLHHAPQPPPQQHQQMSLESREHRAVDAASIGEAALGDWELEEAETWREMAREWYATGVAETPGSGKLQHHLALLSKGEELKGLYHYSKSLCASHPYLSARESILPLFEEDLQARRTQADVSSAELFVHLHGMLFTRIALDDFDACLARFLERLQEDTVLAQHCAAEGSTSTTTNTMFADAEWCMMAVINLSALMQYGAEDGVLKQATAKDAVASSTSSSSSSHHRQQQSQQVQRKARTNGLSRQLSAANSRTPQAIMLNSSSLKRSDAASEDDATADGASMDQAMPSASDANVVKQLSGSSLPNDEDPLVFRLAQRLAFSMLEILLQQPTRLLHTSRLVNPYIVLLLTFLSHLAQHSATALQHLERAIPWAPLALLFNELPVEVDVRITEGVAKVGGVTLPEDWCVRGMEWAGRHLFARGHWKAKNEEGGGGGGRRDRDREEMPTSGGPFGHFVDSEMEALRFDIVTADTSSAPPAMKVLPTTMSPPVEVNEDVRPSSILANARWRRVAAAATNLVRNVAGLDYHEDAASFSRSASAGKRFVIVGHLASKLARWTKEEAEAVEAERMSRELAWQRNRLQDEDGSESGESGGETEDDSEDEGGESDSSAVKELKLRRRQLQAIIKQARLATKSTRNQPSIRRVSDGKKHSRRDTAAAARSAAASALKVIAGYTVLVFDTNILLSSMNLFRDLLESRTWTLVVPLAVITELDGLKKNSSPLGAAAQTAIAYLESAFKTYSMHLKVLTSRGNWLQNFNLRTESIDFANPLLASSDHFSSSDLARNMDDVILRSVGWQKDHFTNRLAIVNASAVAERRKVVEGETTKVVLVTLDRNLRLKARARGLDAADEKFIVAMAKPNAVTRMETG